MTFLYPSILWALTALLIPIAVHLFNFRRHKTVYFSNTTVLKTIQQENAKTKKLKYLVVLALRCLFIAALVLAFAFPYKPDMATSINADEDLVGIYLDNSMSMKAQSSKTTLLEDARESAKSLLDKFSPSTRYVLMTNSFEVQNEYPMNRDEMLDQLDRMKLDGQPLKMNALVDRFQMLKKLHGFEKATLFMYSDFQKNQFDLAGVQPDSGLRVVAVPMQAEVQSNVSIDSVWLGSPVMQVGLTNEVHVMVANHGEKEMKGLPVNLSLDGKNAASATVDVEGGRSAELVMQFMLQDAGDVRGSVSLMDYPITFDDVYRFVISTRPVLKVVELNKASNPSSVALVFTDDPQYEYVLMDPNRFDLGVLSQAQLIVVSETSSINDALRRSLMEDAANGASVVFFCDNGKVVDTNTMSVNDLAVSHEFFNDMIVDLPQHADLPQVKQHVRLKPAANTTVLMHLDNGDPMLTTKSEGRGQVFEFATTLDERWSTLSDNSLFVPMLLKMALLGGGVGRLSYTLGEDKTMLFGDLPLEGLEHLTIKNEDDGFEMMPAQEVRNNRVVLFYQDALPEAGFYELLLGDSIYHVMAWNDSRLESDMAFVGEEEISNTFKEAGIGLMAVLDVDDFSGNDLMQAMARQSSIWKWFVLLALLALAGEVAVLRFWK
ncbi:MAG: BatA and WFA domain-containing protein [Bacteroidales bacterium]|nr:BatA and WFA domain-containing protein [Bacteroidales bacterium]